MKNNKGKPPDENMIWVGFSSELRNMREEKEEKGKNLEGMSNHQYFHQLLADIPGLPKVVNILPAATREIEYGLTLIFSFDSIMF